MACLVLIVGLIFVTIGAVMVATGAESGWLVLGFFGVCAAAAANELWPGFLQSRQAAEMASAEPFPGPLVLRSSNRKTAFLLLTSAGFAGACLWLLFARPIDWRMSLALWPGVVLFGGSLPLLALILFKGSSLQLRADGFLTTQLRRSSFTRWDDTGVFAVAAVPPAGTRMVAFDQISAGASKVASLNVKLIGYSSALPDSYGLSPENLAVLLNHWREQALSASECGAPD